MKGGGIQNKRQSGNKNKTKKGEKMLGFYLKNRRLDKKLTIAGLSKKANISATMIVKYENDKAVPNIKGTEKLAKGLGMTYAELRQLIVEYTEPGLPKGPEVSE
jgi:transcriptional regulator with XRE-family HTH domain